MGSRRQERILAERNPGALSMDWRVAGRGGQGALEGTEAWPAQLTVTPRGESGRRGPWEMTVQCHTVASSWTMCPREERAPTKDRAENPPRSDASSWLPDSLVGGWALIMMGIKSKIPHISSQKINCIGLSLKLKKSNSWLLKSIENTVYEKYYKSLQ